MDRAGFPSALRRMWWLLLAALWAGMAIAQTAPTAEPKIVLQASSGFVEVAAKSRNGKYVWTGYGMARELLLWDNMERGGIIDRLRLPSPPGAVADFMRLTSMTMSPDGRTLRIDGQVFDTAAKNGIAARSYSVDTASRRISIVPSTLPPEAQTEDRVKVWNAWDQALRAAHGHDSAMTEEAALRLLPKLPRGNGYQMARRSGKYYWNWADVPVPPIDLHRTTIRDSILDANLSPDDRYIAVLTAYGNLDSEDGSVSKLLQLFDLDTGQMLPSTRVAGGINRLAWLDRERLALFDNDLVNDPLESTANEAVSPLKLMIVNRATGAVLAEPEARCFMAALPDGRMLGAGLANCRKGFGADKALQILNNGQWQSHTNQPIPPDARVRMLAVSPAGDNYAYILQMGNGQLRIQMADITTGSPGASTDLSLDSRGHFWLSFSPDGQRLWIAAGGELAEWNPSVGADGKAAVRKFPGMVLVPQRMASDGRQLLVSGQFEERIKVVDLASGEGPGDIDFPGAPAAGYMRTRPAFWAASTTEGIRIWDQRTGAILFTISLLPGGHFVAVAPDGRYDTNMGLESENFRWLISDRPLQSLAPQTLMRGFYEPRLTAKLLDCSRAGNCATALHKLPSLAGLNRALPYVDVMVHTRGVAEPGRVILTVTAIATRDPETGLSSGVYGLKLFMNNREILKRPDNPLSAPPTDLAAWREANFFESNSEEGAVRWEFNVPVPTDGTPAIFTAYSFNSDRLKSRTATASFPWEDKSKVPRPRRAFVLTIGVNDYAERRLNLNFAVPDAELIGQRLAAISGYDVRRITLTSTPNRPVTAAHIASALKILGGTDVEENQEILAAAGHDGARLTEATPDDIVIISFSGHGHAAPSGTFSLLASDARWGALDAAPDPQTVISADVLTLLLSPIQAGEIAFIIDACHSGAAVNTPDFRPGPMGDPGLGQLAFDKGMRILAATQGDDVALENPTLAHGLLSAALGEGLTATGGPADMDHDGKILLDEWLRYAVARLPSLHEEVRRGGGPVISRGVRLVLRGSNEPPPVQEPSLFDFTNTKSPVLLRGQP